MTEYNGEIIEGLRTHVISCADEVLNDQRLERPQMCPNDHLDSLSDDVGTGQCQQCWNLFEALQYLAAASYTAIKQVFFCSMAAMFTIDTMPSTRLLNTAMRDSGDVQNVWRAFIYMRQPASCLCRLCP